MDVYLDNAATSHPKPEAVTRAVLTALTDLNGNPGRSGHRRALEGGRVLMAARGALSTVLNAPDPDWVAFSFNCTDALNLAIKGGLRRGDHVVTSRLEHNSVLRPLFELYASGQIELTLIDPEPDGRVAPSAFQRALKGNTALAVLTHASNVTGALQPVAEIGALMRAAGVRYLIDGAQALGAIPVDVTALGCDMYAFPGHKALLGPQGTGGLYIAPDLPLRTLREGGTGSDSDQLRQPMERPERYESGTLNLPGIAGLDAGVRYVLNNQTAIHERERTSRAALIEGLRAISGVTLYSRGEGVGAVSFNVGDLTSSQVADALDQAGIAVRGGLHCAPGTHQFLGTLGRGAVRASAGYATEGEDIDALLRAVRAMV